MVGTGGGGWRRSFLALGTGSWGCRAGHGTGGTAGWVDVDDESGEVVGWWVYE